MIVFTVGVAPVFLDRVTRELRLPGDGTRSVSHLLRESDFRTLSVDENVENLNQIISTIRERCPDTAIFLTLSPVPLNTTFEYPSAIMADCVSKSVLWVAIDQVIRQMTLNVHYWPAFEAARWIGGYHGGAYGMDDGSPFHVSHNILNAITTALVDSITIKLGSKPK